MVTNASGGDSIAAAMMRQYSPKSRARNTVRADIGEPFSIDIAEVRERNSHNIPACSLSFIHLGLCQRDTKLEKSLSQFETLRRMADKIVAAKHADAGVPMSTAWGQVEALGKIVARDWASVRGNDLKNIPGRR